MSPTRLILCVFVLLCSSGNLVLGKDPGPLPIEDTALFAWYDQLGIEDFSQSKLVRVRTGGPSYIDDTAADEPLGYLLWEKGGQFRVLFGDLTVATYETRGKVGWRAVSLDEETAALVRILEDKDRNQWPDIRDSSSQRLDWWTQDFVLARYCAARGRNDLAARLLQAVSLAYQAQGAELQERLSADMGRALRWRATLALVDTRLDRHALAALFRTVVRQCPKSRGDAEWCAKTAEVLEQMAVEEDAHRKISAAEFAHLSPAEQARELVFQLRDDYRMPSDFDPPNCRPWPVEPTTGNGAFQKLVTLGLPAVPALLEAAKDERPSRSVSRGVDWQFQTLIKANRDLALEALGEIAGVDFTSMIPHTGSWATVCEQAQELAGDWWKTTQEKGDIPWLRAHVMAGGEGALPCLGAIAERHPEILVDVVRHALPSIKDNPMLRANMLEPVRKINTPEVTQLLLDELAHGPTVNNRVAAALILRERHQPEALSSMLAELTAIPPATLNAALKDAASSNLEIRFYWTNPVNSPASLLGFLVSSDSTFALGQIRETLPRYSVNVRGWIIQAYGWRVVDRGLDDVEPAGKELSQAVESLLIVELNDTGKIENPEATGLRAPNLAEIAAELLARNWPKKYDFDANASAEVRASQLAKIRAQTQNAKPKPPKL